MRASVPLVHVLCDGYFKPVHTKCKLPASQTNTSQYRTAPAPQEDTDPQKTWTNHAIPPAQKTCLVKDPQVIQHPTKNLPTSVDYDSARETPRAGGYSKVW
ncbi:MAG TPA: hypothetical protein V6D13_18495 [Halomicronema sp.]